MKIQVGDQNFELNNLRVTGEYAILTLSDVITSEQMEALKTEPWSLYEEYALEDGSLQKNFLSTYMGYNEVVEYTLTMKRTKTFQDEIIEQEETLKDMATYLLDEVAVEYKQYFDEWAPEILYFEGERVRYRDFLYKVKQEHISQADWTPDIATDLYSIINNPNNPEEILEWVSGQSYSINVKVSHNDKIWISMVENNTWEPGAPGVYDNIWKEVV